MHYQYGRNDLPNPQKPPKASFISKVREKFKEKEPTHEEIQKLALQAKRETLKTQIAKAKSSRPSRFSGFGGSGSSGSSGRRSRQQQDSGFFGTGNNNNSWLMGPSEGPSLSFITGQEPKGRGRKQDVGFGKGLTDLF